MFAFYSPVPANAGRTAGSRVFRHDTQFRYLPTIRNVGHLAQTYPYKITRAATAFNDVFGGDYSYIFAPASRRLLFEQPGFTLQSNPSRHRRNAEPPLTNCRYASRAICSDGMRALLPNLGYNRAPIVLVIEYAW